MALQACKWSWEQIWAHVAGSRRTRHRIKHGTYFDPPCLAQYPGQAVRCTGAVFKPGPQSSCCIFAFNYYCIFKLENLMLSDFPGSPVYSGVYVPFFTHQISCSNYVFTVTYPPRGRKYYSLPCQKPHIITGRDQWQML